MPAGIVDLEIVHDGEIIPNSYFDQIDLTDEWIVRRSGISSRRWWPDDLPLWEPAGKACRAIVERMGRDPGALIVVSTSERDRVPGLAQRVATAAGVGHQTLTFDMNSACTGYIAGLTIAAALVDSGQVASAIVCTAEAMSRITNKTDRQTGFLFGDGVAATLIESRDDFAEYRHVAGSDGDNAALMIEREDGVHLEGMAVYDHAVRHMSEMSMLLYQTEPRPDAIIGHQANGRILQAVQARSHGVDAPFINKIETLGNTSSASIPLALALALRDGELPTEGRLAAVAYGAGESWGGATVSYRLTNR